MAAANDARCLAVSLTFGTVCSGIEAPSNAWEPLGWRPQWFSEIDPFASSVLAHYWPHVPNLGDMEQIHRDRRFSAVDVLCGGTPCQSFSVAGLRRGLDDARGNLALVFCRLVGRLLPRWVVWENVPGALSSDGGRAFGSIIGALDELGYGLAWRSLDAQYFGLAQRRKRVFVVGYLGDWRRAAAVLFEPESVRGDSPPSREAGRNVTGTPRTRSAAGGEHVANAVRASGSYDHVGDEASLIAHALRGESFDASEDGTGRGTPLVAFSAQDHGADASPDLSPTLSAMEHDGSHANGGGQVAAACFDETQITSRENRSSANPDTAALAAQARPPAVAPNLRGRAGGAMPEISELASVRAASGGSSRSMILGTQVRRLTPRECERLQGFPDDYTLIPYRGKSAKDSPRYRALGNSIAVPVLRWIGERMAFVDTIGGKA